MPSDHEPCCDHVHGHSCRREEAGSSSKAKSKSTPPKATSGGRKKGGKKRKEELSADTILAKIAELEAGRADSSVPNPPPVVLPPAMTEGVGLHISADLREKYFSQVASTEWERQLVQAYQKKVDLVNKERDATLAEVSKLEDAKQKLDNLCKQLQARNKEILDGVRERGEEEQQKRRELSERFSVTITEITARMEQQQQERLRMAAENDQLRQSIEALKDTILAREAAFKATSDKKDAELRRLQDTLVAAEARVETEELKFLEWRESMEGQGAVIEELRAQLHRYSLKFEQFQSTLAQANPVFVEYKQQMELVSKRIRQLEQDNQHLRLQLARADLQIVDLAEQRSKEYTKATRLEADNERLQALAKRLTAERAQLKAPRAAAPVESIGVVAT